MLQFCAIYFAVFCIYFENELIYKLKTVKNGKSNNFLSLWKQVEFLCSRKNVSS